MEFTKSVSNPLLMGAIELMKAEPTPEHRKMVSDEIVKAKFLCPVVMNPLPQPGPDGVVKPAPGTQMQFPMLTAPDGKQFFMAFTDSYELQKWKDHEDKQTVAASFDDYAGLLFKKDPKGQLPPAIGFVINPFGANIVVPREMIAQYMAARAAQAQKNNANGVNKPTDLSI